MQVSKVEWRATTQEHNSDLTDEQYGVSSAAKQNEIKVV
jgi:hypothetical protein